LGKNKAEEVKGFRRNEMEVLLLSSLSSINKAASTPEEEEKHLLHETGEPEKAE
jgi:hypothetical protein